MPTEETIETKPPTVGGVALVLQPPSSLALAYDVCGVADANANRACWAALAVCYRGGPLRITETLKAHRYDVLEFGGAVFDELVAAGHDPKDLTAAGIASLKLITGLLADPEEVAAAEDFSEHEEGSTTP